MSTAVISGPFTRSAMAGRLRMAFCSEFTIVADLTRLKNLQLIKK